MTNMGWYLFEDEPTAHGRYCQNLHMPAMADTASAICATIFIGAGAAGTEHLTSLNRLFLMGVGSMRT